MKTYLQRHHLNITLSIILALLSTAFIGWVNYLVIGSWFGKDGPANLGSIEVSYVSMGRFLSEFGLPFPGGTSWAPFWYFGFPFHLFYTPLLPFLEVLGHKIFGLALWESYRLLTGIGYILAPVSVFFLGWQLSKKIIGGLIAGILFTVGPTLFYFILPATIDSAFGEVAADRFSLDFWDPRRFTILVRWGEGPHIFSLIFVPLVGVFFLKVLREYKFRWVLLSSLFLGLSALTNSIGFFASLIVIGVFSFVKLVQDQKTRLSTFKSILTVGALTFGLISFWYNISFISSFFKEGSGTGSLLISLFPWGWIGILVGVFVIYLIFSKVIRNFGVACSILLFLIFFGVVAYYYLSAPPEESYRRIEIFPQALRYNVEADLSLSLLIGVLFAWLVGYLGKKLRMLETAGNIVGVLGALVLVWYIQPFIPVAAKAAGTVVDIRNTGEYEIATWLKENTDERRGERVFVPGNYGFYLNYFTNVWQHRGALFQAATHPWVEHMHYQMANGSNSEIALAWLTITNTKYAVVTTAASRELYKEMKSLRRFESFPVAHAQAGDIIYEVPLKRSSLAKPVNLSQMRELSIPKKADDKKSLLAYAQWVEDSSNNETTLTVVNNDTYRITGKVSEGEAILVQVTGDSGWSARDMLSKKGLRVAKDPMGFLILISDPRTSEGKVDITLKHGRTWVIWLGYLTTFATIVFIVRRSPIIKLLKRQNHG